MYNNNAILRSMIQGVSEPSQIALSISFFFLALFLWLFYFLVFYCKFPISWRNGVQSENFITLLYVILIQKKNNGSKMLFSWRQIVIQRWLQQFILDAFIFCVIHNIHTYILLTASNEIRKAKMWHLRMTVLNSQRSENWLMSVFLHSHALHSLACVRPCHDCVRREWSPVCLQQQKC